MIFVWVFLCVAAALTGHYLLSLVSDTHRVVPSHYRGGEIRLRLIDRKWWVQYRTKSRWWPTLWVRIKQGKVWVRLAAEQPLYYKFIGTREFVLTKPQVKDWWDSVSSDISRIRTNAVQKTEKSMDNFLRLQGFTCSPTGWENLMRYQNLGFPGLILTFRVRDMEWGLMAWVTLTDSSYKVPAQERRYHFDSGSKVELPYLDQWIRSWREGSEDDQLWFPTTL